MKRTELILMIFLGAALLFYTGIRADRMSMTHDESGTFLRYHNINVWQCFTSPSCWEDANNHLLNTLLMQMSIRVFGVNEFGIRLQNVFAHLLFLLFSILLIRKISPKIIISIGGFILLNVHLYMLDFFSLARGYGLCLGFQMMSIYFFYEYLDDMQWKNLLWSFIAILLAVASNFTALNWLASVWISIFVLHLTNVFIGKNFEKKIWIHHLIPSIITIVCLLVFGKIILLLSEKGEFNYGASSISETYLELVKSMLYGYWANDILLSNLMLYGLTIIIVTCICFATIYLLKKPDDKINQLNAVTCLIFISMNLIMIFQHKFIGSEYLTNRKALIFYPIIWLMIYLSLVSIYQYYPVVSRIFIAVFSVSIISIFFTFSNLTSCREWWFDTNTKEMILYVHSQHNKNEPPVRLAVDWLFYPSSEFYITIYKPDIELMKRNNKIDTSGRYDYYYIGDESYPLLENNYQKEKEYLWGRSLLKRKK